MYNKSISKRRFSKVLLTFADELLIASLQISVYWLSGSDVIYLYMLGNYKVTDNQPLNQILLVILR